MRSAGEVEQVLALAGDGLNHCEIARRTGIPRATVRDWVNGKTPSGSRSRRPSWPHDEALPGPRAEYAYLLGLYLGDGSLAAHPRGVYRLRVTLDAAYPGIIASCAEAVTAVSGNAAGIYKRPGEGCKDVGTYWLHWPYVLPQHGPGMKHTRPIVLVDWQQRIVDAYPEEFLRGLVHSDGSRSINRVSGRSYPRYMFSNRSADIRRLFCDACERIGVHWTQSYKFTISVARARDVARLDTFIGPKA
jgi:hypothetical protein